MTVCVIIPAHNAARTIQRAVRAALEQPEAAEVVVVDDGSTDRTGDLALAVDDGAGRLKVLRNEVAGGPSGARARAIAESASPWFCPLDADDFFLPGRLGKLLAQADGCDFIADDLLCVVDGREDETPGRLIGDSMTYPSDLSFTGFVQANLSRPGMPRKELGFLKPLMRRAFLEANAIAYDPTLRLGEDFILYATALAKGARFKVVAPCGYVAVQRADSLSSNHRISDLRALLAASQTLEDIPTLSATERAAARAHRLHVAGKLQHREFLQAKKEGGLLAAAAVLAQGPLTVPYVIHRTALDVLRRA